MASFLILVSVSIALASRLRAKGALSFHDSVPIQW
jgi:hypothetical protein